MLEQVKLISFDFDGTICPDSANPLFVESILKCNLCELFEMNYISQITRKYLKEALGKTGWADIKRASSRKAARSLKIPKKTISCLKELSKNYKIVITTTASLIWVETILNSNKIRGIFSEIYSTKDHFNGLRIKEPYVFEKIARVNRINPEECIHVGDKYFDDFIHPKEAGFNTFLINHGNHKSISFEELAQRLEEVSSS
jgi:FMN phosphatase YigB (HAD superfamily)